MRYLAILLLLLQISFISCAKEEQKGESWEVPLREFESLVTSGDAIVVDVRETDEVAEVRVDAKNYVNIPLKKVEDALGMSSEEFEDENGSKKPNQEDELIFICRSGRRSLTALNAARGMNYMNTLHFLGGTNGWTEQFPQRVVRELQSKSEL